MKNLTKKLHLVAICSFSLFFMGISTSLVAQEEITETKKVVIITKKIDKDGNETIERIEKDGEEVDDAMIDKIIEEAKKSGKSVDIRIEKESQKIIKNRKKKTTKEIDIDQIEGNEIEDVMIFKTDDGKIIEINEEEGEEIEVTVTVDDKGQQTRIKTTKKIIKMNDGKEIINIEEEEGMEEGEVNVWIDDKGNKTIIKKESKRVLKGEDVEMKLKKLNITLPILGEPVANYVHAVTSNNWVFLAGKGPRKPDGKNIVGKLGKDLSVEQGYEAARWAGINLLAALKGEIGDLNRVVRIVKVKGMVNATAEFTDHSKVINGFSDLMVEVFGEKGKHARAAVGMNSLPGNMAVEIEVVVEIE